MIERESGGERERETERENMRRILKMFIQNMNGKNLLLHLIKKERMTLFTFPDRKWTFQNVFISFSGTFYGRRNCGDVNVGYRKTPNQRQLDIRAKDLR